MGKASLLQKHCGNATHGKIPQNTYARRTASYNNNSRFLHKTSWQSQALIGHGAFHSAGKIQHCTRNAKKIAP
jgi:hypothetical protein